MLEPGPYVRARGRFCTVAFAPSLPARLPIVWKIKASFRSHLPNVFKINQLKHRIVIFFWAHRIKVLFSQSSLIFVLHKWLISKGFHKYSFIHPYKPTDMLQGSVVFMETIRLHGICSVCPVKILIPQGWDSIPKGQGGKRGAFQWILVCRSSLS